jgi:hypothetical protein
MNIAVIIILTVLFVAAQIADILTTKWCDELSSPYLLEKNRRYRLPSGRCDLPRLIRDKSIFAVIILAATFALFYFGAGLLSFLALPISAFITSGTAFKNYKLYKKYRA